MADTLQHELSRESQTDLAYLKKKLGAAQVAGPELEPEREAAGSMRLFHVSLRRQDGKSNSYYGPSPGAAVLAARKHVEEILSIRTGNRRVARGM